MASNCESTSKSKSTNQNDQRIQHRRKQGKTLDPSELLQIPLDQETVQKYIRLKRKQKLESDRTTVYCPRQWCQGPARSKKSESPSQDSDPDSDSDVAEQQMAFDPNASPDTLPPPHDRLAVCEDCAFAFCKVCKVSWHGEFSTCFPRKQHELTAEEKATEDYMKKHTASCPYCGARCQKTIGCNHMICSTCKTDFCNLCSSWLDPINPFKHFNTEGTPCYMRLWEQENGTDGDPRPERPPPAIPLDIDAAAFMWQAPPPPQPRLRPTLLPLAPPPQNLPHRPFQGRIRRGTNPPPPPAPPTVPRGRQARIQLGLERLPARVQDPAPPMQGLQHFLQLVRDDEEDEWDSDELGDGDDEDGGDGWEIPVRR